MSFKILSHFSAEPFVLDRSLKYDWPHDHPFFKPRGLWLSDELDFGWEKWCRGEKWNLKSLKHETLIKCDTSKWLVLPTENDVRAFWRQFRAGKAGDIHHYYVDWARVEKEFSGILISPYQWRARFDLPWYYGWDCASGCVWDLATIEIYKGPSP